MEADRRYDYAKTEFGEADEVLKTQLVYAYFGLAVYYSQVIEETFAIMLIADRVAKNKEITNQQVNDIIANIDKSKKTMGAFITEVKHAYKVSTKMEALLSDVVGKRNYLVHQYFKENSFKYVTDEGKLETIKYFCDYIDNVKELDTELLTYYANFLHQAGITEDMMDEQLEAMKRQEEARSDNLKA